MAADVVDDRAWSVRVWRRHYLDTILGHVQRALPMTTDCVLQVNDYKSPQEVLSACFAALHAIDSLTKRLVSLEDTADDAAA